MLQSSELAEIRELVMSAKSSIETHRAECNVRNEQQKAAEAHAEHRFEMSENRLSSLEESRAKLMGYMFGIAAGGSVAGGGIVAGLFKLMGH